MNRKTQTITNHFILDIGAVNGKIYAIGGYNYENHTNDNDVHLNTVQMYDPSTDTWSTKTSMPTARADLAAVAVNGKIFAIGGYNNNGSLNIVQMYNPITNSWSSKTNMPTEREDISAIELDGKIFAIGGYKDIYYVSSTGSRDFYSSYNISDTVRFYIPQ